MRGADQRECIIVDTEHRIVIEIDARDVGGDAFRRERRAETKPSILARQREEMREERGARVVVQALGRILGHRLFDAELARRFRRSPNSPQRGAWRAD